MLRNLKFFIVGLCCLSLSALGSSLEISPVRVELNAKQRIEVITLVNRGDAPITLQSQIKKWQQTAGKDVYSMTTDLLVTPPIVTIQPNKAQVLRVGLKAVASPQQELSYRLFITEIPQKQISAEQTSKIRIVSRIGIPIFVTSTTAGKSAWNWQARREDQNLELSLNNPSNRHIKLNNLTIRGADKVILFHSGQAQYVLPRQTVQWSFPLPKTSAAPQNFFIEAITDKGRLSSQVSA